MSVDRITIVNHDATEVESWFRPSDQLRRLVAAGIIHKAKAEDWERLRAVTHLYRVGSGAFVADNTEHLYVLDREFDMHHLKMACTRMNEQAAEAKRRRLFEMLDSST